MKLGDKVLIVIIVLVIAAYFIFNYVNQKSDDSIIVLIKQNGELVKQFKITETTDMQETFEWKGHKNTIYIKDKTISIIEADCKDKLCVNQGKISRAGESIICLPNRFVVELKSAKGSEVDFIVK